MRRGQSLNRKPQRIADPVRGRCEAYLYGKIRVPNHRAKTPEFTTVYRLKPGLTRRPRGEQSRRAAHITWTGMASYGCSSGPSSVEVFNRHASSAEIDEALRFLHGLHMVRYQTETTGGAPLERWFYSAETGEKSE